MDVEAAQENATQQLLRRANSYWNGSGNRKDGCLQPSSSDAMLIPEGSPGYLVMGLGSWCASR